MEVPGREFVEVGDLLVLAPVDEEAQPRAVGVDGRMGTVSGFVLKIESYRFLGDDGI